MQTHIAECGTLQMNIHDQSAHITVYLQYSLAEHGFNAHTSSTEAFCGFRIHLDAFFSPLFDSVSEKVSRYFRMSRHSNK